jgi:hypothetical protein
VLHSCPPIPPTWFRSVCLSNFIRSDLIYIYMRSNFLYDLWPNPFERDALVLSQCGNLTESGAYGRGGPGGSSVSRARPPIPPTWFRSFYLSNFIKSDLIYIYI